jgi:CRISPR-associated protein Cas1
MDVLSAIQTVGLDPYLGSLHEIVWGRPSLACDLVEEFRAPVADRLILGLINRRVIDPNDFIRRDTAQTTYTDDEDMALNRPVSMKPQARTRLMAAYEEMMNATLPDGPEKTATRTRTLILNQARRFAEALNGGAPYQPFAWR